MTVIGSVEVDVLGRVDQNAVTRQISAGLDKPARTAGQAAGKTMGRHIGDSAAAELEKSGARFARSGRLLSNVFTQNSAAALGPLQEVANKVELIGATLDSTKTRAGGMLLGIGAAATGVGAFLSTLESREQGATNRLAASIAANGQSIDDYRDRIDAAVKAGERFGQSGNQTIDAIQALTIGLHDPAKALDELRLVEDIAAAKQISLSSAANLVRQAYNGNTRVLKAFGVQVADVVDGQKLLADAHATAGKAAHDLSSAQQTYTDKLAIYRDTLKPTLAQQIALKNAHDKVLSATAAQTDAQQNLTDAQTKANAAGSKGQEVLDKLAKITAGQAAASADTFTGHLKAFGAALEDDAAKVGGHAGKALIEFGPALAGAGFLIESGLIPRVARAVGGLIGLGGTAAATAVEVEAASTAEVASLDTVVLAIRELQVALTGIGPAAAAGAVEVEAATAGMDLGLVEVATTAEATSVAVGAAFTEMLGPIGLVVAALGLVGYLAYKDETSVENLRNLQAGNPTATIDLPKQSPTITFDGHTYNADGSGLVGTGTSAPYHRHAPQLPDDYAAKNARQRLALAGQQQHGVTPSPANPTGDPTLQAFLDSINGGSVASAGVSKALADAQKAAADRARELGKTVTDGLNSQLDAVKQHAAAVNDQLKTIIDFRNQVVSSASSFTSLSGLLPDNSLATSHSLVAQLHQRNAAEVLFGKNIHNLAARHLDPAVIAQIEGEGPDRGRALAAALAQGSDADIRQLNLEEQAARRQAQVLGSQAVTARFGAGTQARANAELVKLNAQIAALNKLIDAEPAKIAKAVEQAQTNAKVSTRTASRTAVPR